MRRIAVVSILAVAALTSCTWFTPTTPPASSTPDMGTMPTGFTLPMDVVPSKDMDLLGVCGPADHSALGQREASRFWDWVSETAESSRRNASLAMTSTNAANELVAQVRGRANDCIADPVELAEGTRHYQLAEVDGSWDQVVAVVSEITGPDGTELEISDGTVLIVAQRGPAVVAESYSIYFARPITADEAAFMAEGLVPDIEHLLGQLEG